MVVDQWVKRSGDPQFKSSQPQNTPSVNCIEKAKLAENVQSNHVQILILFSENASYNSRKKF